MWSLGSGLQQWICNCNGLFDASEASKQLVRSTLSCSCCLATFSMLQLLLSNMFHVAVVAKQCVLCFSCCKAVCTVLQLLLSNVDVLFALAGVCDSNKTNNDRTLLATALLNIFRHERQEAVLLRTANDREIDREGESVCQ